MEFISVRVCSLCHACLQIPRPAGQCRFGSGERQAGQEQGLSTELPLFCSSTAQPAPGGAQNSRGSARAGTATLHRPASGEMGSGTASGESKEKVIKHDWQFRD